MIDLLGCRFFKEKLIYEEFVEGIGSEVEDISFFKGLEGLQENGDEEEVFLIIIFIQLYEGKERNF